MERNYKLDLIRGLSAIIVLMSHLRAIMFVDYSALAYTSVWAKTFYLLTGLGHQAVMIFFVLSGFFVGGSVISKRNNFKFKDYLISRLARLYTPLIPMLFITFYLDSFVHDIDPYLFEGKYYSILSSGPKDSTEYSLSIYTFLGNISFIQNMIVPVYGSNTPLWSLSNEFWYYILFPLVWYKLNFKPKFNFLRIVLVGTIVAAFYKFSYLEGFLIWLLGTIVYYVSEKWRFKSMFLFILSGLFFATSIVNSKYKIIDFLSSDLLIGMSFSILLYFLIKSHHKFKYNWLNKFSLIISEFSYSLYISHFPILMILFVLKFSTNQLELNITNLFLFLFILILICFISYGYWWIFERNTSIIRGKLRSQFK